MDPSTEHGIPSYVPLAEAFRRFERGVDTTPRIQINVAERTLSGAKAAQTIPRRWDWREHMTLPPTRNQGGWNACFSFAAVAVIEARRNLAGLPSQRLIPGYIHNCRLGVWDPHGASNADLVLDACRDHGVAAGPQQTLPVSNSVCSLGSDVRISSWRWLTQVDAVFRDLVSRGPLLVSMNVEESFHGGGGAGIYDLPLTGRHEIHAVCLVGYDLESGLALILNSAGPDWGNNGVGRVRLGSGGLVLQRAPVAVDV